MQFVHKNNKFDIEHLTSTLTIANTSTMDQKRALFERNCVSVEYFKFITHKLLTEASSNK